MSFLGEIKRRKVFQVAAVYAVVAWLIIQVVDVVSEPLSLPASLDTVVIVLVGVGFPLAIVLAWAFDLTPEGVVRTPPGGTATLPQEEPVASANPRVPSAGPAATVTEPPAKTLRNSVAVLPLENLSPNPDDAFFAAGIHEEILNQLTKIRDLSVIARTSVKKFRDTDKSIAEIAAELGVGTVMEGSVRYAGERVRVTAQLIDAKTENHVWSEVYERDLADVFAIQADVATKIAEALRAELSVMEKHSVAKMPTHSPEAYALYLRALAIFQEQGHVVGASPRSSSNIQSDLDQAIALDPDFALAYVARARLNASRLNQDPGVYEGSASRREELEALALRDLQRALAIDAGIGAAHGILARIHQFNWRGSEARAAYHRAVELSPNEPVALMDFAVFNAASGHPDEAIELAEQAIRLDPNSADNHNWLGIVQMHRGELDAALTVMRRAAVLAPTFGIAIMLLAYLEAIRGDRAEALKYAEIAEPLLRDTTNPAYFGQLAFNYAKLGRGADVERIFHRLEELAETHQVPSVAWIQVYLALGNEEQALHWLNQAADHPDAYIGHFALLLVKTNAFAEPVLEEPAFRAARQRLGFRD